MFRIEMLPAGHGDAILVEYGDSVPPRRILIDGGTPNTYKTIKKRLNDIKVAEGVLNFELLVITHIDDDHIGGVLALLEKQELDISFCDVWFNGYGHLLEAQDIEAMGPVQGERLTAVLRKHHLRWNHGFNRRSLCVDDNCPLPEVILPGGLKITLLGPDRDALAKLQGKWKEVCEDAGLDPDVRVESDELGPDIEGFGAIDFEELIDSQFDEDSSEANGSSISFIAEHDGKRVLFTADAHPSRLIKSIDKLVGPGNKLKLDACKLSHHGSDHNTSLEFVDRLDCSRYLVSTDGSRFRHPDPEAIARVIRAGSPEKRLYFNYRSKHTSIWDDNDLQETESYTPIYPETSEGLVIAL